MSYKRKTSISWVEQESIKVRETSIENLIGNNSYGEVLYLLLLGKKPPKNFAQMLEAILISVIDHGVKPPSTISAVTVANTGGNLNSSIAAGILAINEFHGGAIEKAMNAIFEAVKLQESKGLDKIQSAEELFDKYKSEGKRISGFGHRFHGSDPRTVRLFELAEELKVIGKFVEQAKAIEKVAGEKLGRNLPINADGAIAALLCEMDFPPKIANGIFMIARVPGLVAHVVEEQENNPPMRTVDVESYEFEKTK